MRITRAAKVAAFPLIVLALVALVACQGGPGTKGDKGDKGDMGDMGMDGGTGAPGTPGTNALSPAPTDGPRKIINFDVDSTPPIDLSIYFTGGKEPRVFKVDPLPSNTPTDNGITIDPEDVSGSMLPLTVTKIAANVGGMAFDRIELVVTATDADLRTAMNTVTIKRNAPPTFPENGGEIGPITVGVQEGMRPADVANCGNMLNFCIVPTMFDAPVSDTGDKMDYTINTDVVSVSATDIAGEVKITGLTATSEALTVKITAKDEGELTVDSNEFILNVNAAPTVKRAIAPVHLKSRGTDEEKMVSFVIDSHFDDSDALTFMLVTDEKKAHDGAVADVTLVETDTANADNDNMSVTVMAQGTGDTMVYLKATEDPNGTGIGQSVEASFMVTVD